MEKITNDYERSISPVPRKEYNKLKKAFEFENALLTCDSPKDMIVDFFIKNEIKTIAFIGKSMWGDTIINLLKNDFEVYSYDINESIYDAIIIKNTMDDEIRKSKKMLYDNKNFKKIFTINDFINVFK